MSKKIAVIAAVVGITMNIYHDGYEKNWWWDNVTHFLAGFVLGILFREGEREKFLLVAIVWEAFEWKLATMKLYDRYDYFPRGPRSMGFEDWSFDHAVEDTILDTVVGLWGVKAAKRLKK